MKKLETGTQIVESLKLKTMKAEGGNNYTTFEYKLNKMKARIAFEFPVLT